MVDRSNTVSHSGCRDTPSMRMRRHIFTEERLRVRKANIIRRSISRFNARAKRRHHRASGRDVRSVHSYLCHETLDELYYLFRLPVWRLM